MTIRVVVADDHPMFRFGLSAMLETAPDIQLIGEATTGRELIRLVKELRPDVVLTDLTMPDLDGAAACASLLESQPELPVVVLTMHDDDESVMDALRVGARGYLLKGADGTEIAQAIRAAASGGALYGPGVAGRVVGHFTEAGVRHAARAFPELTPREREVLELVAEGCNNHEIARRMHLAEQTIRNHVSSLMVKLQVPDRAGAIVKARRAGLGRDEDLSY